MTEDVTHTVSEIIGDTLGIRPETIDHLISLIVAIIAVFLILKIIESILLKYIRRRGKDTKTSEAKLNTITKMLDGFFKCITFFFILVQILIAFGVDKTQILAVSGALSVALGFAAQGVVKDIINGVIIVVEDQYKLGDFVEINGYQGEVEKLTMRVTQLRDVDGSMHIIPNSSVLEVTTLSKEYIKAIVVIGIEYGVDTAWVIKKLEEEMEKSYKDMSDKMLTIPQILGISAFQDSCIDIKIVCDAVVGERVGIEYALRLRIKEMFDREGIVIPFPQREVNIVSNNENIITK